MDCLWLKRRVRIARLVMPERDPAAHRDDAHLHRRVAARRFLGRAMGF